ncbi:hypothetical protein [Deinococcus sp.]|uniref:hypothetical protein n=1 Tax=Deinococcus sp. TaxID=47478 RepID=UPI0025C6D634|nr:hypothetical protein [Deinococcus sp.]
MSFLADPAPTLAVYYGPANAPAVATLGTFARVAVQSALYTPAQLGQLRRGGTQVLAYLSLGEDHALQDWACLPGSAAYHLRANPAWNSVLVDVSHPDWQRTVLERAGQALQHADGLLLDTLDSADSRATLTLLGLLRQRFPGAVLWANRGFGLWPQLSGLLGAGGGVLFEAFSTSHSPYALHSAAGLKYTAHWLAKLRRAGVAVHALDYADRPALALAARQLAAASGLPTFVSNRGLTLAGGWVSLEST